MGLFLTIFAIILKILLYVIIFLYILVIYENRSMPDEKKPDAGITDILFGALYEYALSIINIFFFLFGYFDYRGWFEFKDGNEQTQPIILLHGYMMNRGCMVYIYQKLKGAGYVNVYPINLKPKIASIEIQAGRLSEIIEEILNKTGEKRLSIIAHSQGGLISRYYIKYLNGNTRVDKLITLGTPHYGTKLSAFGIGRNSEEMIPNSRFLNNLNSSPETSGVRVLSIYSPIDSMVLPYYLSHLEGAENFIAPPLGHFGILFSRTVIRKIQDFLRS